MDAGAEEVQVECLNSVVGEIETGQRWDFVEDALLDGPKLQKEILEKDYHS
jgi:hypothetical protein